MLDVQLLDEQLLDVQLSVEVGISSIMRVCNCSVVLIVVLENRV